MSGLSVLILEDKVLLAEALAISLKRLGYNVVGKANSAKTALELLSNTSPDLAILDIDLGEEEMNGIDVARHIKNNYKLPYIFLTGKEDELTLTRATDVNPSAFLLKPASDRTLKSAIQIAVANFQAVSESSNIASQESIPENDHLFVRYKGRFEKILQSDILWIQADSSYSIIHTHSKTYTVTFRLKVMETRLNHPSLIRVHRSSIVNIDKVEGIEENSLLIGKHSIPVSKSYRAELSKYFNIL